MESKKVEVKINNIEYTLVSNEPEEYVQRVALLVNKRMQEISGDGPQLSTAMKAVLTAINIADDYLKNESVLDNLRIELKGYVEEATDLRIEADRLRKEMEVLKGENQSLKNDLGLRSLRDRME